jgi:hypothetical protein
MTASHIPINLLALVALVAALLILLTDPGRHDNRF